MKKIKLKTDNDKKGSEIQKRALALFSQNDASGLLVLHCLTCLTLLSCKMCNFNYINFDIYKREALIFLYLSICRKLRNCAVTYISMIFIFLSFCQNAVETEKIIQFLVLVKSTLCFCHYYEISKFKYNILIGSADDLYVVHLQHLVQQNLEYVTLVNLGPLL